MFALLMVLTYPIGIPSLYLSLVYRRRGILALPLDQRTEDEKEAVEDLAFLVKSYKPHLWFFESIECVRRLALSSFLVFISPGSAAQGLFALLLSMGSQRLHGWSSTEGMAQAAAAADAAADAAASPPVHGPAACSRRPCVAASRRCAVASHTHVE